MMYEDPATLPNLRHLIPSERTNMELNRVLVKDFMSKMKNHNSTQVAWKTLLGAHRRLLTSSSGQPAPKRQRQ